MSAPPTDPAAVLRSRSYIGLLVVAAILGVLISAAAYGFLALVGKLQSWLYTSLPQGLGLGGTPWWWPLPLLTLAGVLVGLIIRHLPGTGGHSLAECARKRVERRLRNAERLQARVSERDGSPGVRRDVVRR